ncbi:hypothetical protein LUZ60_000440 [Juncus effusus]|nr:hypothetical protein LUZ60_000440 [Juncus effusus]
MASEACPLVLGHLPKYCKPNCSIGFSRRSIVVSCKMRNFSSKRRKQQSKQAGESEFQANADVGPPVSERKESQKIQSDVFSDSNTRNEIVSTEIDENSEDERDEGLVKPSNPSLQNLMEMIKNTENNILLLNQARIQALQELDKVTSEKEALKSEIQILESKLAETDLKLKIQMQERIKTEFLETQLEELKAQIFSPKTGTETGTDSSLINQIKTLKVENSLLNSKLEKLKETEERVLKLEREKSQLEESSKDLLEKIEVLEASLKEADEEIFFNESLQQKINNLEEQLRISDKEISNLVKLYEESVKEFQSTIEVLKEESLRNSRGEIAGEIWSSLSLLIDGWFIEKKISRNDCEILREMIWERDLRLKEIYQKFRGLNENEIIAEFLELTLAGNSPGLHVIHIAAEMAPVAKVGGLGDVVSGLSKALHRKGHLVEIIIPKYDCMISEKVKDLKVLDVAVQSYFDGHMFRNKIWIGTVEGLPVYFIEPLHPSNYFARGKYYGEGDDFKRFSYFSRAALELIFQSAKKPDIIHCHDWQTAFVGPLYWEIYAKKGLNSARISFTCHNFEYQGAEVAAELAAVGLDVDHLNRPDRLQDHSSHDRINPVKGAIVYSNIVTTVSPTYAQEVRSPEGGRGLHETIKSHSRKFVGILNGIDTETWNPNSDSLLHSNYSSQNPESKSHNKLHLKELLNISTSDPSQPLVGCITRLVPQKGVHLIRHAIYKTLELGGQFVLLGSSPVPHIQREFEEIAGKLENSPHARLILKYDDELSHLIFAASDMFIIPSIFEPCGLTQMIAMRYGSVPIARKTGGLNDSVFDLDDNSIPAELRNGFTFLNPDEQGLSGAMVRAFNYFKQNPEFWRELVIRDMTIDFSWDKSASKYEELYEKAVARARAFAHS